MVKKSTIKLSGVSIFGKYSTRKNFQSNLIFVVAFVPESQELKVSYNGVTNKGQQQVKTQQLSHLGVCLI